MCQEVLLVHQEAQRVHQEAQRVHQEAQRVHQEVLLVHHEAQRVHQEVLLVHQEAQWVHQEEQQEVCGHALTSLKSQGCLGLVLRLRNLPLLLPKRWMCSAEGHFRRGPASPMREPPKSLSASTPGA
jgi:hypothetical protein